MWDSRFSDVTQTKNSSLPGRMALMTDGVAPESMFERHCGAAWLKAGPEPMTRQVSRDGFDGPRGGSSGPCFVEDEGVFGGKVDPYVEGQVSVLARCRSRSASCQLSLAWRVAYYSLDLVDGALRVFRSEGERDSWRSLAANGENLAKWTSVITDRHVITPVAHAEASPPRPRRRKRHVPSLSDVREEADPLSEGSSDEDVHTCKMTQTHPPGRPSDDDDHGGGVYCTFEVWNRAPSGAKQRGAPLLKFAASPDNRDDLDTLHDALEAIADSCRTHVVEP